LWLKAQSSGDWWSLLDQPETKETIVARLGMGLPIYKDWVLGQILEILPEIARR